MMPHGIPFFFIYPITHETDGFYTVGFMFYAYGRR